MFRCASVMKMNGDLQKLQSDYGFENYTSEVTDDEKEYAVSKEKVKSSFRAIQERNKKNRQRDLLAYEKMASTLPKKPPCVKLYN